MTVKELIDELKKHDEDKLVFFKDLDGYCREIGKVFNETVGEDEEGDLQTVKTNENGDAINSKNQKVSEKHITIGVWKLLKIKAVGLEEE